MNRLILEIHFDSAFHHGSGYGLAGLVDRTLLRDSAGVPFLAASAIKGKLRYAALRVLTSENRRACQYGDQRAICKKNPFCRLCILFGSPIMQGKLLFSDAYPAGEEGKTIEAIARSNDGGLYHRESSIRFGIGMNRGSGTVRKELLFSSETLPEGIRFEANLRVDALDPDESELLRQACRVLTHFGAGSARGLGRCRYELKVSE